MISILAQERLLGAALGSAFVGGIVIEQRLGIYKSIQPAETSAYQPSCRPGFHRIRRYGVCPWKEYMRFLRDAVKREIGEAIEAVPRKKYTTEFAHMWNKAVDQTLGSLVAYLSSRGW